MALTFVLEFPGGTQQQYDQVIDRLQLGGKAPPGAIFHVAGPIEGGWCVVDVWESQEAFDRFIQEKLGRAIQEAGLSLPQQPKVFPVHNILERAR
jgi:quinol monooxygenase YgiN